MKNIKNILIAAALLVGVWLIGYVIGRNHFRDVTEKVQTDTLIVRDTVREEKPVPVETTDKETLYVAVHDTTRIHDTLYIMLQKESKEYRGEDYMARVSGYEPSLDFIEVYPKTTTITETKAVSTKSSAWGFSVDLGIDYGKTWSSRYVSPNIGAELRYKRISLGLRGGIDIGIDNNTAPVPQLYGEVSAKYSLFYR